MNSYHCVKYFNVLRTSEKIEEPGSMTKVSKNSFHVLVAHKHTRIYINTVFSYKLRSDRKYSFVIRMSKVCTLEFLTACFTLTITNNIVRNMSVHNFTSSADCYTLGLACMSTSRPCVQICYCVRGSAIFTSLFQSQYITLNTQLIPK